MRNMSSIDNEAYIHLSLPRDTAKKSSSLPNREKTSLYIPTAIRDQLAFTQSKQDKNFFVCYDMTAILRAISFYGDIGYRYDHASEQGLEYDLTKQQPIVYTIVIAGGHLLFYRRAYETKKIKDEQIVVEERMRGKISIGFGGHTTGEDRRHLTTLGILFPGIHPEIQTISALEQSQTAEWQEELGIGQNDIKIFRLLGAFHMKFGTEILKNPKTAPVEAFHIGICAVAELDEKRLAGRGLYLPKNEIAEVQWVPLNQVKKTLRLYERRGATIDLWTKYIAEEFLPMLEKSRKPAYRRGRSSVAGRKFIHE